MQIFSGIFLVMNNGTEESDDVFFLYNVQPDILLVWETATVSLSVFSL